MYKPLVKFCGNRSFEDWSKVIFSKADVIGIIFAESKRQVTPEQVSSWIQEQPLPQGKKLAGIFVNANLEEIEAVLAKVPLDIIQCHGKESPTFLQKLKETTGLAVWKAIHHDYQSLDYMKEFSSIADGYVVDTKSPKAWGGTGQTFDWEAIPSYLKEADRQGVPCFIAGGIKIENISQLLQYHPIGIDLASGIEIEEQKSRQLIKNIEKEVENYVNNISR
ncbi:phosphoribosylanthranilate isomerase [Bacillus pinisoli]|uniref:phosphoribosylanthranilate isomerase n=1 Tax=Bacillus pinisoli TaxID=2901866 RepID=UPI001FF22651|nr:phosphoribosylanthranilate isomerase [Bacillus pinisoli]